jgi:hypothetical protein
MPLYLLGLEAVIRDTDRHRAGAYLPEISRRRLALGQSESGRMSAVPRQHSQAGVLLRRRLPLGVGALECTRRLL